MRKRDIPARELIIIYKSRVKIILKELGTNVRRHPPAFGIGKVRSV